MRKLTYLLVISAKRSGKTYMYIRAAEKFFFGALVKMIFIINTVTRHFEGKQVEYTKASS